MHTRLSYTLIVLYVMARFRGFSGVSLQNIVVHEGGTSEETEAARAAKHTAENMLSCLLQPVAHGILELLIPHHGPFM